MPGKAFFHVSLPCDYTTKMMARFSQPPKSSGPPGLILCTPLSCTYLGQQFCPWSMKHFSWKVAEIQVIANDRYMGRLCTYPDVVMAWGAIPEREVVPNMHVGSLVEISSIILSQPHVFPLHNQSSTFRFMFSVPKMQRRQCTSRKGMTVVSLKGQSYSCK
jgi:hypothetical protein